MSFELVTAWRPLALRGALAIAFGAAMLALPGLALATLVLLFGGYALAEGLFNAAGAFRASRAGERWLPLLLESLVSIAVGALAIFHPRLTLLTAVYLIAFWSVTTGVFEIAAAVRLRKVIEGEWLLALAGVASIAFGALLLVAPGVGALTIALWVGAYATLFGATLVGVALRLRPHAGRAHASGRRPMRPLPGT
jgi:uncharacterized membrane protein HdeD (DUF308 family)